MADQAAPPKEYQVLARKYRPQTLEDVLGQDHVTTTLRNAIHTQLPVVLVTSEAVAPLAARQLARRDIVVLPPEEAARGMGASIATGVAERSGAPGWLVLPGDMPLVKPATLLSVATALEQQPIVFAQHQGRRGHPVGFSAELYSELIMLGGDEGARRLLARYPALGLEVEDRGVLVDVDTVADLKLARELAGVAGDDDALRAAS